MRLIDTLILLLCGLVLAGLGLLVSGDATMSFLAVWLVALGLVAFVAGGLLMLYRQRLAEARLAVYRERASRGGTVREW